MNYFRLIATNVVVAIIVCLGMLGIYHAFAVATPSLGAISGNVQQVNWLFTKGASFGATSVEMTRSGVIGAGTNQGYWTNKLGRTVYVDEAQLGFESGTASSSLKYFIATSTATTLSSDFTVPLGTPLVMNGATTATSTTGNNMLVATSTSGNGANMVAIPDGSSLIFQVQEKYGCKSVGNCETATSTNRGITNFIWYFQGHYAP